MSKIAEYSTPMVSMQRMTWLKKKQCCSLSLQSVMEVRLVSLYLILLCQHPMEQLSDG